MLCCTIQSKSAFHSGMFVFHRGLNLFNPKTNKAPLCFPYAGLKREQGTSSSLGAYGSKAEGGW